MKINFGQKLVALNGTPLRLGQYMDSRLIAVLVQEILNKCEMPMEHLNKMQKRLEEVAGKELTLSEAVVTALLFSYEDEKTLAGSTRIARLTLARRCNKLGMVKISEADVKQITPLTEKYYLGSLISPQIETLLQGKSFSLSMEDEEEEDEKPTLPPPPPPPPATDASPVPAPAPAAET